MQEYGPTWRTRGALMTDSLMTADPKALHHIFQKASSHFIKKPSHNHMSWLVMGPGVLWSQGDDHTRHRRIMSPAFSMAQMRSFLPLFQRGGNRLVEKWRTELVNNGDGLDMTVNAWLSRVTLDIICEAAFDYDSRALEDAEEGVLAHALHAVIKDIDFMLPKTILIYRALWDYLPHKILKLARYTPAEPFTRLRHLSDFFTQYSQRIVSEKRPALTSQDAKTKDIMSILIRANESSDNKTRLDDEELRAEMFTIAIGGHETTSTTLALLLYELARNQTYQTRLREDVRAARARVNARGDTDFTLEDLENIPTLVNTIKETLRMHPIVAQLPRIAVEDEVIPLDHPIISTNGETVTEIPISKGQVIVGSFASYHRLPEVWGEDAHVWNPDRFTKIDSEKQTKVGVFSNLMSFSAGTNACIGWRFSIIEQQTLVAEVIDAFQFSLPSDADSEKSDLVRAPAGTSMVPIIRGKQELGTALRLRIAFAP
ncbi:PAH-inducible cytochrome P450 monooxygenase PC-PAH 4 [Trametes maxima]|nr:PAH-inducible cytochrome P450 monooxygenase PC-PAH 4 [Trametes maxima]